VVNPIETVRPDLGAVRTSLTQVKETRGMKVFHVINVTFLLGLVVVTLYPFVNMIAMSFSSSGAITAGQVNLWPIGFNTSTLRALLNDSVFWRSYANTLIVTVGGTVWAMSLTTTFAYAISRKTLAFRNGYIGLAVFTMFFGGGIIPNFILIGQVMGLRDNLLALILPGGISVFNLLVMKSFFENFPAELEEAAYLDGLTQWGTFFKIVMPLSKAILATMILFYAVAFWNSWFGAFMFMDTRSNWPVMLYLRNIIAGAHGAQEIAPGGGNVAQIGRNVQAVAMLLTTLPIMCVYPFVQKYFVSGVMLGSVKG
jgi:putative aldouronate transport system permease protein